MIDHSPFTRLGSGGYAVLLIHGIASSPGHFRDLAPVIPEDFSVYGIVLEGHNGTVKDFSAASMAKWKAQVTSVLEDLFARHDKVVILAHSMGTLFAIQAAIDHPDQIPGLFLLSVPTRPRMRISTIITCLKVALGIINDARTRAMSSDTGIQLSKKLWLYIGWVPRMLELLLECRRVRRILPQLCVPTQSFQSQIDELVSIRSCRDLENHPYITNTILSQSGHFVYGAADLTLLQQKLKSFLEDLAGTENKRE